MNNPHTPVRCSDCNKDIAEETQFIENGCVRCEKCNLKLDN